MECLQSCLQRAWAVVPHIVVRAAHQTIVLQHIRHVQRYGKICSLQFGEITHTVILTLILELHDEFGLLGFIQEQGNWVSYELGSHPLCLVGAWRGISWVVATEWKHHRRSLPNTTNAIEPSIEGKTATKQGKTRLSEFAARQRCRKTGPNLLANAQMGSPSSSAQFSRHCYFWLPLVPIDGSCHDLSKQRFISYEEKCFDSWIASKNKSFFRHGIHMLRRRWE